MIESFRHVVTLGNSIIGVSVLAMPFCFKQCGIILGILMMVCSAFLTRFCCHVLLKASLLCRRKTYELLAFHSFGPYGKLIVETSIIGFLLGILISFFVVMGDLGPGIIAKFFNCTAFPSLRTVVLTALGLGVALPLGLLKNIDSLGKISTVSFCFYAFLVLKIFVESFPVLISGKWLQKVVLWQPDGILQCLPIFSMALSCQTQIFEIYESLPEASLGKMNRVIKLAVTLCTTIYISVGFFGYVAFCHEDFSGNILINMPSSFVSELIKLGFVLSVALSFPLVIFPCRSSLHSLLFRRVHLPLEVSGHGYIPESRFRIITVSLVLGTLVLGIICPNIELVLGIVGSTIGTIICIIFPAMLFINVTNKNTFERTGAQIVLCAGVFLLVSCTYVTIVTPGDQQGTVIEKILSRSDEIPMPSSPIPTFAQSVKKNPPTELLNSVQKTIPTPGIIVIQDAAKESKVAMVDTLDKVNKLANIEKPVLSNDKSSNREEIKDQGHQEPPNPQEPDDSFAKKRVNDIPGEKAKDDGPPHEVTIKETKSKADGDANLQVVAVKQEQLLKKLEAQHMEQKELIEAQKNLLLALKEHKDEHHKGITLPSNRKDSKDDIPKEDHSNESDKNHGHKELADTAAVKKALTEPKKHQEDHPVMGESVDGKIPERQQALAGAAESMDPIPRGIEAGQLKHEVPLIINSAPGGQISHTQVKKSHPIAENQDLRAVQPDFIGNSINEKEPQNERVVDKSKMAEQQRRHINDNAKLNVQVEPEVSANDDSAKGDLGHQPGQSAGREQEPGIVPVQPNKAAVDVPREIKQVQDESLDTKEVKKKIEMIQDKEMSARNDEDRAEIRKRYTEHLFDQRSGGGKNAVQIANGDSNQFQ